MGEGLSPTLLGIGLGYLLGSLLPAWVLARARGIDIRSAGTGNPGTANAAAVLGYRAAALVAPYDVLKAPIAIAAARSFGAPWAGAYLAGAAAFVGHRAPFYLGFRGGAGIAPLSGIALFAIGAMALADPRYARTVLPLLVLAGVLFFAWLRRPPAKLFVFVLLPAAVLGAFALRGITEHSVALLGASALIVGHRLAELLEPRLAELSEAERVLLRRKWVRPAAIAFPLGVLWEREATLIVLTAVLFVFAAIEVARFRARSRRLQALYRPAERNRISSVVIFLLGMLVTLTLFRPELGSLAVLFLIFGDLLAFCVGTAIGGPGFLDKTWSGTAACLVTCTLLVAIYASLGLVSWPAGLVGAVVATCGEALPIADDNFVVPVASALAMSAL